MRTLGRVVGMTQNVPGIWTVQFTMRENGQEVESDFIKFLGKDPPSNGVVTSTIAKYLAFRNNPPQPPEMFDEKAPTIPGLTPQQQGLFQSMWTHIRAWLRSMGLR